MECRRSEGFGEIKRSYSGKARAPLERLRGGATGPGAGDSRLAGWAGSAAAAELNSEDLLCFISQMFLGWMCQGKKKKDEVEKFQLSTCTPARRDVRRD